MLNIRSKELLTWRLPDIEFWYGRRLKLIIRQYCKTYYKPQYLQDNVLNTEIGLLNTVSLLPHSLHTATDKADIIGLRRACDIMIYRFTVDVSCASADSVKVTSDLPNLSVPVPGCGMCHDVARGLTKLRA